MKQSQPSWRSLGAEHQPMSHEVTVQFQVRAHTGLWAPSQEAAGLIPSQGHMQCCELNLQKGAFRRQLTDVTFSH